jgi:hypothetical protein
MVEHVQCFYCEETRTYSHTHTHHTCAKAWGVRLLPMVVVKWVCASNDFWHRRFLKSQIRNVLSSPTLTMIFPPPGWKQRPLTQLSWPIYDRDGERERERERERVGGEIGREREGGEGMNVVISITAKFWFSSLSSPESWGKLQWGHPTVLLSYLCSPISGMVRERGRLSSCTTK